MALRTMSVDIDFGIDLSEINKLDSSVDNVVQSVTGGMGKAEKSIDKLGDNAVSTSRDVTKISKSLDDVGSSGSEITNTAKKVNQANNPFY